MISQNKGQFALSSFILLASLIFLGWGWEISQGPAERLIPYRAVFSSVTGLKSGSKVIAQGINIGKVETIRLDPAKANVEVSFRLKSSLNLPKDSTIVLSRGMTGESWLTLLPGESKDFLKANEKIIHTLSPPSLEQQISSYAFGGGVPN